MRKTGWIVLSLGLVFGALSCKKDKTDPPTVKVFDGAITIDYTKASVSAEVTDQGGAEVKSRGIVYGKSGSKQDTVFCGSGLGVFSAELAGLEPNVTYTYEAFARNVGGVGLSGKVTFATKGLVVPTVKTLEVSEVTTTTAVCKGKVTEEGGASVTKRGACWSKSHNPTIGDGHAESGEGVGEYTCKLTGLEANTTYYVRAYATNSKGTGYGEELELTTENYGLPKVLTGEATDISEHTAKVSGEVSHDGGIDVTERGICWSTSPSPAVDGNHITGGTGIGSYTCTITGLSSHTKYYVRAYAINSIGTSYGEEKSLNTSAVPPTVSTGAVSNVTYNSAQGSGNVTDDGGSPVIERGVCWGTAPNPTVSGSHAHSGTGTGEYTVNMTGLTPDMTYYVRAYAVNSKGITYGVEKLFYTLQAPPDYSNLVLNELNGATKFIELYNKGDRDLTLNGVYIQKDDNENPIWTGDNTITIQAKGYLVLYSIDVIFDHQELDGTNLFFNSGLSGKKAIKIALFLADGTQLDVFIRKYKDGGSWGDGMTNVNPMSYARTPDAGNWMLADLTPGEPNPMTGDPIPMGNNKGIKKQ